MSDERTVEATFVGQVASVRGATVTVRLRETPTTLVMVGGHAYRVGQIGAFLRVPLGYTQLYGVCTQVGADAVPRAVDADDQLILELPSEKRLTGFRWMTMALFGESVGKQFDRGVGQYPTVGDEVHLVTPQDLRVIYDADAQESGLPIGRIAGADEIAAGLDVASIVSRHASIVGSTGSGKSNLVTVLLEAITDGSYPNARVLVVDPHGEYASALAESALPISTGTQSVNDPNRLRVPYWALAFDQLLELTMGPMQPAHVESIRDRVRELKLEASSHLDTPPPPEAITADSPIPFSIRRLWLELEEVERATFEESNRQNDETRCDPTDVGDAAELRPPAYPAASPYNQAPYFNRQRRGIGKQLDLLRSRLLDSRYAFMFNPSDPLHPDEEGRVEEDLPKLVHSWIGGDKPVTVVDVSGIPTEVVGVVVGTMMQIVYDTLFWAMDLPVGGRQQPLLVVVDEAHRFLPAEGSTPASSIFNKVAKEGRKYGVGLLAVTQRPSDIDATVLSQCGSMIALRVTNPADKAAVSAVVPDDLGGLTALVPSLRTGEALVLGDAMHVPSRVRIRKARRKPVGEDPLLPSAWQSPAVSTDDLYSVAIANWRSQSTRTLEGAESDPSEAPSIDHQADVQGDNPKEIN